jgi:hypothetical protein
MKKSAEYMMILRNTDWDAELTTEEVAAAIERYHQWFQRLSGEGVLGGGRPLFAGGRVISMDGNGNVTDGPFVETKEVIGGYIVINAASLEEATEIAKTFPPLECGATIELRELAIECPVSTRYEARLNEQTATV